MREYYASLRRRVLEEGTFDTNDFAGFDAEVANRLRTADISASDQRELQESILQFFERRFDEEGTIPFKSEIESTFKLRWEKLFGDAEQEGAVFSSEDEFFEKLEIRVARINTSFNRRKLSQIRELVGIHRARSEVLLFYLEYFKNNKKLPTDRELESAPFDRLRGLDLAVSTPLEINDYDYYFGTPENFFEELEYEYFHSNLRSSLPVDRFRRLMRDLREAHQSVIYRETYFATDKFTDKQRANAQAQISLVMREIFMDRKSLPKLKTRLARILGVPLRKIVGVDGAFESLESLYERVFQDLVEIDKVTGDLLKTARDETDLDKRSPPLPDAKRVELRAQLIEMYLKNFEGVRAFPSPDAVRAQLKMNWEPIFGSDRRSGKVFDSLEEFYSVLKRAALEGGRLSAAQLAELDELIDRSLEKASSYRSVNDRTSLQQPVLDFYLAHFLALEGKIKFPTPREVEQEFKMAWKTIFGTKSSAGKVFSSLTDFYGRLKVSVRSSGSFSAERISQIEAHIENTERRNKRLSPAELKLRRHEIIQSFLDHFASSGRIVTTAEFLDKFDVSWSIAMGTPTKAGRIFPSAEEFFNKLQSEAKSDERFTRDDLKNLDRLIQARQKQSHGVARARAKSRSKP